MVTYGFYDSFNHDRRYNAIQMSSIFDGIIKDGIFMSIGSRFEVTSTGEDMFITVGTGRAWFDHTWTLNDAPLPIELPASELLLNRYDAVVLEVNSETSVRENSIKIVSGAPSSNPVYPTLKNTKTIHQYPLAYIYVEKNATSVRQADITSMIGKGTAPYVTGIIDTIDIENMVAQWEDQWKKFFEAQTNDMVDTNAKWKKEWEDWYDQYTKDMDETAKRWKDLWHEWYHMYTNSSAEEFANWKKQQKEEFVAWFDDLKDMLTDKVEAMLAAEIEELKKRTSALEKFKSDLSYERTIYESVDDMDEYPITDSSGDPIEGSIIFADAYNDFKSFDTMDPVSYKEMPIVKNTFGLGMLLSIFSMAVRNIRFLRKKFIAISRDVDSLNSKTIIESGSNENGYYRKYADGTLEMWGTVNIGNISVKNVNGSMFGSEGLTFNLPQQSSINVQGMSLLARSTGTLMATGSTGGDNKTIFGYFLISSDAIVTASSARMTFHCFGTWK